MYFTGLCAPTEADYKQTPFLICHCHVLRALTWLKLNHKDYFDLIISEENLNALPECQPPVAWYHMPSDGSGPAASKSVHNIDPENRTEDGLCTVAIYGIIADKVAGLSQDARVAIAIKHLKEGGQVIGYDHSAVSESMYDNLQLFPGMFLWLFPYGLGGFENDLVTIRVPLKS